MDGLKGAVAGVGGGGRVGIGHHDDDINDGMQCSDHPYRPNPGGICAFCLQEKLGKLVSTSFPLPLRASTALSSSSPPSFRSDNNNDVVIAATTSASSSLQDTKINSASRPTSSRNINSVNESYARKATRNLFLLSKKKNNVGSSSDNMAFKRSKSTCSSSSFSRRSNNNQFDRRSDPVCSIISPRKRNGFWSFLYLSSSSTVATVKKNGGKIQSYGNNVKEKNLIIEEEEEDDNIDGYIRNGVLSTVESNSSNFERKVSRSRSVGCGSRSFSGDFFERISTGFGDCTLRRVESHREGKLKVVNNGGGPMKEKVKCRGIFGGFNIITSSSSSSSSSSYWVSSTTDHQIHVNVGGNKSSSSFPSSSLVHGRNNKSWGWANFASPMRAFNKHSSKDGKREGNGTSSNNKTPALSSIPSLLTVRS